MKKILLLPYFLLIFLVCTSFVGISELEKGHLVSSRVISLLNASFTLSFSVAFFCTLLGLAMAVFIKSSRFYRKAYRWFFLLFSPLPYYIYVLAWINLVRGLAMTFPAVTRTLSSGLIPCVIISVFCFLPVSTGLILVEIEHLKKEEQEIALLYKNWNAVFISIALPQLVQIICVAMILIFVLSITDYSIASLFQYNTYTVEIFSAYSRGYSLPTIAHLSLPIMVITFVLVAVALSFLRKTGIIKNKTNMLKMQIKGGLKSLSILAIMLGCAGFAAPIISLLISSKELYFFIKAFQTANEEMLVSLLVAIISGMFACVLAFPVALFCKETKNLRWIFLFLCLLPMAVPSSLIAMGLLKAVNGSAIHGLSQLFLFPAVGSAIKFMPFAFLIIYVYTLRLDKSYLEMARCIAPSKIHYCKNILFPMHKPAFILAFAVVACLTFGDETIGLILMPPGYQTVSVMIYSFLHYGASEIISAMCLLIILFMIILFVCIYKFADFKKSDNGKVKKG